MTSHDETKIRSWLTSRIGKGMKMGLETCDEMLDRLGRPEMDFPCIHVAGSNGKGTLCANLSSIGAKNGELIGVFTSPHLVNIEERTRIDGKPIKSHIYDKYLHQVKSAAEKNPMIHPTYFEITFLVSILAFSEARVDRAIIETGLGGRLDASRLCNADLCAITTISKEHTEILGDSLEEIAKEKSGIYRDGVPLFCIYSDNKKVREIFEKVAGSDLKWFKSKTSNSFASSFEYASMICESLGWKPYFSELNWFGRTETNFPWASGIKSKISAAHNSESFQNDISQLDNNKKILLIGMSSKPNLQTHLSAFSLHKYFEFAIITEVSGGRNPTIPADELENEISKFLDKNTKIKKITNPVEAMDFAINIARINQYEIFITGSIYLIGELLNEHINRNRLDFDEIMTIHPSRETE